MHPEDILEIYPAKQPNHRNRRPATFQGDGDARTPYTHACIHTGGPFQGYVGRLVTLSDFPLSPACKKEGEG